MFYKFLIAFYPLVIAFGTMGNVLVVEWFGKQRIRKKAGNKIVVVLAVNDFVSSIIIPILRILHIFQSDQEKTLCRLSEGIMEDFVLLLPGY